MSNDHQLPVILKGAPKISKFLGETPRATYHKLEIYDENGNLRPKIPGAVKVNGRWQLNTAIYLRETFGSAECAA
jgi:hypothetical protein